MLAFEWKYYGKIVTIVDKDNNEELYKKIQPQTSNAEGERKETR